MPPAASDLHQQGLVLFRQDRLSEAVERFLEAARLYGDAGQPDMAAEMMNNVAVVRLAEKDWAAALAAVTGTVEVFRARGDRLREAQALSNLAAAHDGAGRLDEAAALYEGAIDLYAEVGERANRAACWKALSGLQMKQNKRLQALASMDSALRLQVELSPREKTLQGLLNRAMKLMGNRS